MIYLVPALSLCAFWLAGETGLLAVAIAIPMLAGAMAVLGDPLQARQTRQRSHTIGPELFKQRAQEELDICRSEGRKCAIIMLQLDDADELAERLGQSAMDQLGEQTAARIKSVLRDGDILGTFGSEKFGICLKPQASLDLDTCLQLAHRLTTAVEEPYAVDGTNVYVSACIGFCQLGRENPKLDTVGKDLPRVVNTDAVLLCAMIALDTARAEGPAAIRAYAAGMQAQAAPVENTQQTVLEALENGEIVPWFQPQISTDTGLITGFECLARWVNPSNGMLSPSEFIPHIQSANKMGRLLEVMLYHALTAIKAWDQSGLEIQQVAVNFSPEELSDPGVVEKIAWELDRFEVTPERLTVEILETVVAKGPDDIVTRNIKGLADLGCRIDLDDFGTGHASLAALRRFCVSPIKVDRSFVTKSDRDPEQQRMIRAILTMAERLGLETLAEGVETVGEHALLAQLGCTHVQGFGIGRPMPFDQTMNWIRAHNDKLQAPPQIGRTAR